MSRSTTRDDDWPVDAWMDALAVPGDRPHEFVDARELPPPEPLTKALELLPELDDETVLVQLNDRAPQFLYPRLDERGYSYDTKTTDDGVVTAVWR